MKTIEDLIALLENEVEGAHRCVVEILADGTIDGVRVQDGRESALAEWHQGRADAYRHALAQARHVQAHSVKET